MPIYWSSSSFGTGTTPIFSNNLYIGTSSTATTATTSSWGIIDEWTPTFSPTATTSWSSISTTDNAAIYIVGNRIVSVPRGMSLRWVDQYDDPQWVPKRRVQTPPPRPVIRAPAAPAIIRRPANYGVIERGLQREAAHRDRQARALRVQRERAEAERERVRQLELAEQQRQRAIIENERRRVADEEGRLRAEIRRVANDRAHGLLLEHLTPEQRRMVEQHGWFVVEGGRSKQKYRISVGGVAGNIYEMDGARQTHRLCCHCDHSIPPSDHHLAQKLMLEFAEDDFLRLANRHAV